MRATPSPRVTAYAVLAAVFLLAALGLRRPELAVLALPFALPLALGLRLARAPEIRVQVDVERATALENDELDVELTVSSEVPVERLELVLVVADGLEVVSGASAQSLRLGWEDERTLELKLRCARWGNYELGDVRLRARFEESPVSVRLSDGTLAHVVRSEYAGGWELQVDGTPQSHVDLQLPPAGVLGAHDVRERAVGEPHGYGGLLESGAGHGSTVSRGITPAAQAELRLNRDAGAQPARICEARPRGRTDSA